MLASHSWSSFTAPIIIRRRLISKLPHLCFCKSHIACDGVVRGKDAALTCRVGIVGEAGGMGDAGQEKAFCAHRGVEGSTCEETASSVGGIADIPVIVIAGEWIID